MFEKYSVASPCKEGDVMCQKKPEPCVLARVLLVSQNRQTDMKEGWRGPGLRFELATDGSEADRFECFISCYSSAK